MDPSSPQPPKETTPLLAGGGQGAAAASATRRHNPQEDSSSGSAAGASSTGSHAAHCVGAARGEDAGTTKPGQGDLETGQEGSRASDGLAPDAPSGRTTAQSVWQILNLAEHEKARLALATLALVIAALANVALPQFAGRLIDLAALPAGPDSPATRHHAKQRVLTTLLYMALVVTIGALATSLRSFLFTSAGERVVARLRRRLFASLMAQEVGFFDVTRTGELLSRLSEDTSVLQNAATVNLSEALRSMATALLALSYMLATSLRLTLLTLAVVPAVAIGVRNFGAKLRKLSKDTQAAAAAASACAEESLSSLRTVRAFGQEARECDRYGEEVDHAMRLGIQQALYIGVFAGGAFGAGSLAIVSVLAYGAVLVIDLVLTPGALSAFVLYSITVGFSLGSLAGLYTSIMKALGSSERVFDLLHRHPLMDTSGNLTPPLDGNAASLSLSGVWFAYPSRPSEWVLRGIGLDIAAGATVALVGASGGGKSTVVSLMQRFYDPQQGSISLAGLPLPRISLHYLHTKVSSVSQEPVLFNRTIADNIAYGLPCRSATPPHTALPPTIHGNGGGSDGGMEWGQASCRGDSGGLCAGCEAAVRAAAQAANAHDFILAFPDGYATEVGERGVRLSGGQKQRIAIARAVIMDPRVLLLDEATSALDAESEHLVQEAMDRLMKGRTTVVVAHRLSTVQGAAAVAVVDKGIIVEKGTHRELLGNKNGVYAALVRRQLDVSRDS